jgi:gas vesicle protein
MKEARCFFYGLGVGVAAGLLMAPRSGVKTRKMIADTAREGQNYLAREGAGLRDSVVDQLNRTKRAAKAAVEGIGDALEAGKKQFVG